MNEGFSFSSEPTILAYYKSTVLSSDISAAASELNVEAGGVAALNIVSQMQLKVDDEILLVLNASADRIFVQRAQEGSNASSHDQGARVTIYPAVMENSITQMFVLAGGSEYAAGNVKLSNVVGGRGFLATYNTSTNGEVLESLITLHRHGSRSLGLEH